VKKLIVILFSLSFLLCNGQVDSLQEDSNIRIEKRYGFSFFIGGPTFIGVSLDAFVLPQINLEGSLLGLGLLLGANGGIKYHPFGGNNKLYWSPYVGASYGRFELVPTDSFREYYFPIGVNYTGKKWLNFSFDIGYLIITNRYDDNKLVNELPMACLKLGYRW